MIALKVRGFEQEALVEREVRCDEIKMRWQVFI